MQFDPEQQNGFWNRGISACAICDGTSPLIRNKPVAVIGGGDSAMEEACYLTKYASRVYIVHRFDYLEASKAMQKRALSNPKIEVLWEHQVVEAFGGEVLGESRVLSVLTSITCLCTKGVNPITTDQNCSSLSLTEGIKIVNTKTKEVKDLNINGEMRPQIRSMPLLTMLSSFAYFCRALLCDWP